MAFSKLYKLDKNKNLKDMKVENLEGRENELVRNIILKNFGKLFDYLELFNEGKPFSLPYGPKKRIPDSLGFCEKLGKRLYIFEYKSRIDKNVIDQTIKYRNALQENNDSGNNNLNHLRDHWIKTGWTTRDFRHKRLKLFVSLRNLMMKPEKEKASKKKFIC